MEWLEVLNCIEEGEGRTTELKRGLGDLSAIGRVICAFANTEGGILILGVDNDRAIVGVQEGAEKVQERLTAFLQTGCSAPVSAHGGRHQDLKGWVHWLEVPKQRGFEPLRYDGRVWVRRERSSVEPSPTELQELYNAFGYILTEDRSIQAGTASHIDLLKFHSYLKALGLDAEEDPQPDDEDDLRNRGVLTEIGGALRPTLYGALAFGKMPQRYPQTQNFRVDCVAYEGDDRASSVLQVAEITGCIDEQVQRAIGWFCGAWAIRILSRPDAQRSPVASATRDSGGAGQRCRASRLRRYWLQSVVRGLFRSRRCHEPGRLAQPNERRKRARRRPSSVPQ